LTKNAKLEPGVDTLRDPFTGEVYEIAAVLLPEHLSRFTDGGLYRGSATEKCALYSGSFSSREKERHAKGRSFAHKGPRLKETA
jgi:hypothetical protein